MKFYFLILLITSSCTHKEYEYGDNRLTRKDTPTFLISATPQGKDIEDVEYFVKRSPSGKTFEIKYEIKDMEHSLTYSENGEFVEEEIDIAFSSLEEAQQSMIRNHLSQKYKKYQIHETELRTNQSQQKFIDVEVVHPEGPTGLTEFIYTTNGVYVSEKNEYIDQIQTLH